LTSWLRLLPHQIPFRAASAAVSVADDSIEGSFLCTADDALAAAGMPIDVMLIEAMAQFAGGLAFRDRPGHGFLSAIDRCSIDRLIVVGELVEIRVDREAEFGGVFAFRGQARVGGVEVARGRFYLAAPPTT
jgi:3-hydroxymyristoyl/3-hydroxydecanoyl-(acyl carrier protein) dehydratase